MIREYKTIQEINGPLMVVRKVEGVTYDELGEIQLPNGDVRRCKVLEVNGDNAVVQLFESSAGINLKDSRIRFLGLPQRVHPDRHLYHRRPEHPGARPEAAHLLRLRPAPRGPGRPDCPPGQGAGRTGIFPW